MHSSGYVIQTHQVTAFFFYSELLFDKFSSEALAGREGYKNPKIQFKKPGVYRPPSELMDARLDDIFFLRKHSAPSA